MSDLIAAGRAAAVEGSNSPGESNIESEIARLDDLDLATLRERWRNLCGRPAPVAFRRKFLIRALAYQMQVQAFGGLSPATKRRLREIAEAVRTGNEDAVLASDAFSAIDDTCEQPAEIHQGHKNSCCLCASHAPQWLGGFSFTFRPEAAGPFLRHKFAQPTCRMHYLSAFRRPPVPSTCDKTWLFAGETTARSIAARVTSDWGSWGNHLHIIAASTHAPTGFLIPDYLCG